MPRKRMSVKEFREKGYLQEANRLFFHPLGLALEVIVDENGEEQFGGVWDSRDDPEGIIFEKYDHHKAEYVQSELLARRVARAKLPECDENGIQVKP